MNYISLGIFLVIIISLVSGIFSSHVGYSLVVIDNPDPNSMWPTYFQGDLFLLEKTDAQNINIGDVVVYNSVDHDESVIHRVIDIVQHGNKYYFRVKGDNFFTNYSPDDDEGTTLIPYSKIIGRIVQRIPFLGHLSLSMKRDKPIRYLVFVIASVSAVAIVFWPSNNPEKQEGYFEFNRTIIRSWLTAEFKKPKRFLNKIRTSKHRNMIVVQAVIIVILLLIPVFVSSAISTNQRKTDIYIKRISPGWFETMSDTVNGTEYSADFLQMEVELIDTTGIWKRVKGFDLELFGDNRYQEQLSSTRWTSLKDFKGRIIIGASIVIPYPNQPLVGSQIYVRITLDIVTAFFFNSHLVFEDNFVYRSPNFGSHGLSNYLVRI